MNLKTKQINLGSRSTYVPNGTTEIAPPTPGLTSEAGPAFGCSKLKGKIVKVDPNITALTAGTSPTLDLAIQFSADGVNFYPCEAVDGTVFAQAPAGATNPAAKQFLVQGDFMRTYATIGGTAVAVTYSVLVGA